MLNTIALGFAGLLIAVSAAGWFLYSNRESYVKEAIEVYGSAATHATVRVSNVKLSLTTGEGSMGKLRVGSPAGYKSDKTIDLGAVSISIDTSSLVGTGPVVIRDITIDKPDVTYEVVGDGNNLQTIARNAQKYADSLHGTTPADAPAPPPSPGKKSGGKAPERKLIIDSLSVRDGNVTVIHPLLQGR